MKHWKGSIQNDPEFLFDIHLFPNDSHQPSEKQFIELDLR